MKKLPKNGAKSVSANLYLVISVPIDTKYTVVQGKKTSKMAKIAALLDKNCPVDENCIFTSIFAF